MCDVKRCRSDETEVNYKGHEICPKHWEAHCNGSLNLNKELGIKEGK